MMNQASIRRRRVPICIFLAIAVLGVFFQVRNHQFVDCDDIEYVVENAHVRNGLKIESLVWAFTTTYQGNWHPLTWISHAIDIQVFGPNPGWHHLTNLFFHTANTLLLFLILEAMTGALWQSGFVAALFALHPLHVESVAWIAERKDVLSGFFWMLVIVSYLYYAKQPNLKRYVLVLLLFALGLMSKPMLVTLPFVLLLLDYWPLSRFPFGKDKKRNRSRAERIHSGFTGIPRRLIWEKVPLFVFSLVSCAVTFHAQKQGGAVSSLDALSLKIRVANCLVSYVKYIVKMLCPTDLAPFYPHPESTLSMWQALVSGMVLLSATVLVIRMARRFPYLSVGWFWYLGTLVPVIGLVQVGSQSMADRYTYLPLIGLFIMIAWGIPDVFRAWRYKRRFLSMSGGVVLSILMASTWIQSGYWKNSLTLFQHALDVTPENYLANKYMGVALARNRRLEEAISHFQSALKIRPNDEKTHYNLGIALLQKGNLDKAAFHFQEVLRGNPDNVKAHNNLGVTFARLGRLHAAVFHYQEALKIDPNHQKIHRNLGMLLFRLGRIDEAVFHFREALRMNPEDLGARRSLERALGSKKRG